MAHDYEVMKHCVYHYLRYIKSLSLTMKQIEEDIAYQSARLNLLGISYDQMSGSKSSNHDKLSNGVVRLLELRQKWSEEYLACAQDFEQANSLCNPKQINRYILYCHNVKAMTWEDVARCVGYSTQHARRLAEVGVRELYYLMPEEWRRYSIPNAQP